jgi:CheY-like chemotaxis protein
MNQAQRLSILLADDTADIQALITSWLEDAGHSVVCASSGRQVIELLPHDHFDLLVTDILMPDGDGWEAIAEAHRLWPEIRILAISGGAREMPASAVLRVARGAGAISVLAKPFSRPDFIAALNALMAPDAKAKAVPVRMHA